MAGVYDVAVVGAGIIGLATARELMARAASPKILILEKESGVGRHQTGHNSGVIHSGAYYRPGSAKALLCLRGRSLLMDYCDTKGIPYRLPGKLIVATLPPEIPVLDAIQERARLNGVPGVIRLGSKEIHDREPAVEGIAGLEIPGTGIVDYGEVTRSLADDATEAGATIQTSAPLRSIEQAGDHLLLRTDRGDFETSFLVNCAGLYADHVARMAGVVPRTQIIPFRGEFYWVASGKALSLTHLVYPVPDPELPFLGVHLTLTMSGRVEAGPNAVLALAREGYDQRRIRVREAAEMFTFPGFWRMSRRLWRVGLYEQYRSLNREQYSHDLRRLIPAISTADLTRGGAGVRAQAVDQAGRLLDDFSFESGHRSLHVLNAPSPGATSSLAIGEEISRRIPRED